MVTPDFPELPLFILVCEPDIYLPFDEDFKDYSGHYLSTTPDGRVIIDRNPSLGAIGSGTARFDGGNITIWKYANDELGDVFAITFRYREIGLDHLQSKPEAIVSNSGCQQRCTVAVAYDRATGMAEAHLQTTRTGRAMAEVAQVSLRQSIWRVITPTSP